MSLPSPPTALLVTSDADLHDLCDRWSSCSHIALDTEFIRTRTFYSKLGLIQVGDPESIHLLDAVALTDWTPFVELLGCTSVTKVLHSPSEDLELFEHQFEVSPSPLVDTQIGATIASRLSMPGCARLVEDLFGVDLPKGQQRSDWLKRPLTESQKLYAGLDVAYLLPAWEILLQDIETHDRVAWFDEEMQRLHEQSVAKNDPWTIFRKLLKSNMTQDQANALFAVVSWREEQARQRDLPRRFVIGDDAVHQLATGRPRRLQAIQAMDSLGPGQKRKLGPELIEVIAAAEPVDLSAEVVDFRKVSKNRLRLARECLQAVAEEEDLAPEFLASKRALEKLIRRVVLGWADPCPPELVGWRWSLFGGRLVSAIEGS